ncbi:hypothetical protein [Roseibium salinum]|uniref:Uncharacterized protein n=1 Tax=Roseibium salinum TaxID=1604349 RepID=A0ABT3R8W9_9HYPH|nr:hypothetical protein [Roseibium sp. DSM 29163]MCX2725754.1 hypothetical protein [Roseibium sp. DSM 29163]
MNTRSSRSMVTFFNPFTLSGDPDVLPAGTYEVVVEEELLQGLSFLAYRKTATYLIVASKGRTERRKISWNDLEAVLSQDQATVEDN